MDGWMDGWVDGWVESWFHDFNVQNPLSIINNETEANVENVENSRRLCWLVTSILEKIVRKAHCKPIGFTWTASPLESSMKGTCSDIS
jgi:hypothetical protein